MGIWSNKHAAITSWGPPSPPPPGRGGFRVVSETIDIDAALAEILHEYHTWPGNRTRPPEIHALFSGLVDRHELLPSQVALGHDLTTGEFWMINGHTRVGAQRDKPGVITVSAMHVFATLRELKDLFTVQDTANAVRPIATVINTLIDPDETTFGAHELKGLTAAMGVLADGFVSSNGVSHGFGYQKVDAIADWTEAARWILDQTRTGRVDVGRALRRAGGLAAELAIADVPELRSSLSKFLDEMMRQDWKVGSPAGALAIRLTRLRPNRTDRTPPHLEAREFGVAWKAHQAGQSLASFTRERLARIDAATPIELVGTEFDGVHHVWYALGKRDGRRQGAAQGVMAEVLND